MPAGCTDVQQLCIECLCEEWSSCTWCDTEGDACSSCCTGIQQCIAPGCNATCCSLCVEEHPLNFCDRCGAFACAAHTLGESCVSPDGTSWSLIEFRALATCGACGLRHCNACDPGSEGEAGDVSEDDDEALCVSFPMFCKARLERAAEQCNEDAREAEAHAEEMAAEALEAARTAAAMAAEAALAATQAARVAEAARIAFREALEAVEASKEAQAGADKAHGAALAAIARAA